MAVSVHRPVVANRLSSCHRCGIEVKSNSWDFQAFIQPDSGLIAVGDFISIFESREAYCVAGPLGAYESIAGRVIGIISSSRSHVLFAIQYTAHYTVTLRTPFHLSQVSRLRHIQHTLYQLFSFRLEHRIDVQPDESPAPTNAPAYILPVLDVQGQGAGSLEAYLEAPSSPYSTTFNLPQQYSSSTVSSASSLPLYSSQDAGPNRSHSAQQYWRCSDLPSVDNQDYVPFTPSFVRHVTPQQAFAPILSGFYKELSEVEGDAPPSVMMATSEVAIHDVRSPGSSLWEYRSTESSSRGGMDMGTSSSDYYEGSHSSGVVLANLALTNSLDSLFVNIH